jgi:hypothetical protein
VSRPQTIQPAVRLNLARRVKARQIPADAEEEVGSLIIALVKGAG